MECQGNINEMAQRFLKPNSSQKQLMYCSCACLIKLLHLPFISLCSIFFVVVAFALDKGEYC